MAMGTRRERQAELWIATCTLARPAGHPFYQRLNQLLAEHDFDRFVEGQCRHFYAATMGRPGLAPGVYFRLLLVGYFEGIESERGIAWRTGDSLSIREFVGIPLNEGAPDHTTISRTRRLIDLETHGQVFAWALGLLARCGTGKGQANRHRRDDPGGECSAAIHRTAGQRRELRRVSERAGTPVGGGDAQPREKPQVHLGGIEEVVADKGYHSGPALEQMQAAGVRTYIPEKKQAGKRHWVGKEDQQRLVYANRQRLQRPKGQRLLRKRGELIERTFAHCYDTGGMRRIHLRKHNNILKRLLIHVAGANLGLLLRNLYGLGTPRGLQGLSVMLHYFVLLVARTLESDNPPSIEVAVTCRHSVPPYHHPALCSHPRSSEIQKRTSTPDC